MSSFHSQDYLPSEPSSRRSPPARMHHFKANKSSLGRKLHTTLMIEHQEQKHKELEENKRWQGGDNGRRIQYEKLGNMSYRPSHDSEVVTSESQMGQYDMFPSRNMLIKRSHTVIIPLRDGNGCSTNRELEINNQRNGIEKQKFQTDSKTVNGRVILKPILQAKHELIETSKGPMLAKNWAKPDQPNNTNRTANVLKDFNETEAGYNTTSFNNFPILKDRKSHRRATSAYNRLQTPRIIIENADENVCIFTKRTLLFI